MAKHRVYRTPALIATSVAAATTLAATLAMSGSAGATGISPEPSCPNGYLPAINQRIDQQYTICVTAGPSANGDVHAIVRIDPALCAHVAAGTNPRSDGTVPRDAVRTLRCPAASQPAAPAPAPAPATSQPPAPVPAVISGSLPVTG